jgi:hypothetical protein
LRFGFWTFREHAGRWGGFGVLVLHLGQVIGEANSPDLPLALIPALLVKYPVLINPSRAVDSRGLAERMLDHGILGRFETRFSAFLSEDGSGGEHQGKGQS